jgi:hypothetical protein
VLAGIVSQEPGPARVSAAGILLDRSWAAHNSLTRATIRQIVEGD